MSFSSEVKAELCRTPISKRGLAQAEAYGILLYCNQFSQREIRITTESGNFAERLPILFRRAFHLEFDRLPDMTRSKQTLIITDPDKLWVIFDAFGFDPSETLAHHINFAVLEDESSRIAFFRGAFLAGGSVTDPSKRYHLELATPHYHISRELRSLLLDAGFAPKESTRKSNYISYFKQSEAIEDWLTVIGAPISAMEVMNAKAEKDLRGSVNRRVNCDAANLDKAVDAAVVHMEAIRILEERGQLLDLPDKLKEAIDLRVAHPEMTLAQLAELCEPPISKSAFNHRLQKLITLSQQ